MKSYQVDEGQELPTASIGLVCRHVESFVVAKDGEIRQQDGDPENLRGDQRHDAHFWYLLTRLRSRLFTCFHLFAPLFS